MNSIEWRVKKLEDKLLGSKIWHQTPNQTIVDRLSQLAKPYRNFVDGHPAFLEFQDKFKRLESQTDNLDDTARLELVLAYSQDLENYFNDLKTLGEKADSVLKDENWQDMSGLEGRVNKLEKITQDQHIKSVVLDKRTEELIEIYNNIVSSLKGSMADWNQKLEAYENQDLRPDEDV